MADTARTVCRRGLEIVLLAGLLSVPPGVVRPQAGETASAQAEALLARVLSRWRSHETITAHFRQTQKFVGFDDPLVSTGRLRILRPRLFDLHFDPPHDQIQVCDGEWVWTYMKEQNQVFKAPLSPDASRTADLLDWALDGALVLPGVAPDTSLGVPARRLELRPGPNLPLAELRLWVDPTQSPQLIGYEAVDTEGNRTRMQLLQVRYGADLKPAAFRFTPPNGVEVVVFEGSR